MLMISPAAIDPDFPLAALTTPACVKTGAGSSCGNCPTRIPLLFDPRNQSGAQTRLGAKFSCSWVAIFAHTSRESPSAISRSLKITRLLAGRYDAVYPGLNDSSVAPVVRWRTLPLAFRPLFFHTATMGERARLAAKSCTQLVKPAIVLRSQPR